MSDLKNKSIILFLIIIFYSCNKNSTENTIDINTSDISYDFSENFEVVNTVCLENDNRSILYSIDKIEKYEDKLFILNRFSNKEILVFDLKGTYLHNIGFSGEGPGGFGTPYDFNIVQDKIEVLTEGRIITYSINGTYLSSKRLALPAVRFLKISNNYAFVLGKKNKQLFITDENFKIINSFLEYSEFHSILPFSSFSNTDGQNLFIRNLDNTIYSIENDKIYKYSEFIFDKQANLSDADKSKIKINGSTRFLNKVSDKKIIYKYYFENQKLTVFSYLYNNSFYLVLRNKQTKKYKIINIDKTKNIYKNIKTFPVPVYLNENGNLICYVSLESEPDNKEINCPNTIDFLLLELRITNL